MADFILGGLPFRLEGVVVHDARLFQLVTQGGDGGLELGGFVGAGGGGLLHRFLPLHLLQLQLLAERRRRGLELEDFVLGRGQGMLHGGIPLDAGLLQGVPQGGGHGLELGELQVGGGHGLLDGMVRRGAGQFQLRAQGGHGAFQVAVGGGEFVGGGVDGGPPLGMFPF